MERFTHYEGEPAWKEVVLEDFEDKPTINVYLWLNEGMTEDFMQVIMNTLFDERGYHPYRRNLAVARAILTVCTSCEMSEASLDGVSALAYGTTIMQHIMAQNPIYVDAADIDRTIQFYIDSIKEGIDEKLARILTKVEAALDKIIETDVDPEATTAMIREAKELFGSPEVKEVIETATGK